MAVGVSRGRCPGVRCAGTAPAATCRAPARPARARRRARERGLDRGAIRLDRVRRRCGHRRRWRQAEVGRADARAGREQRGALDGVAQFAHVARPAVPQQCTLGRGVERTAFRQEMPCQREDVVGALRQWRQPQFDRVEPVKEILAELARSDQRRQVGIGGADHAHLHLALAIAAEPLEAAGFQHAQQLHLAGQRQRADLVEEQRAAVRGLEFAFARAIRAGVRAGFGAEQFCFDEVRRQRTAVERDERAVPHRRIGVDDLGQPLLDAAVGPGDEHRQIRSCDLPGELQHRTGERVRMHETAQVERRQRLAPTPVAGVASRQLLPRLRQFQQVVHGRDEAAIVPRLGEVVRGAGLHQIDRRTQVRPRRQQDHRQVRVARADLAEQRFAFRTGRGVGLEVHVLHHEVHRRFLQRGEAFGGRRRRARVDVVQREQRLQRSGDRGVVVDDEDRGHVGSVARGRR